MRITTYPEGAAIFARAIAGTPLNMSFAPITKQFELCFLPDASIAAPTEIFSLSLRAWRVIMRSIRPELTSSVRGGGA